MAVYGFRLSNGVDLGNTFAARVSTARAAVGYRNSAGTDLSSLLEPLQGSTPKVGATGYRMSNGVDLNMAFDNVAGVPQNFTASPTYIAPDGDTIATVSCSVNSDGTVTTSPASTGIKWFSNTVAGIGASYQVMFTLTSGSGVAGTFGTWQALSSNRSVSLTASTPAGKPGSRRQATVSASIRRASDSVVVATGTINLDVTSGSDI